MTVVLGLKLGVGSRCLYPRGWSWLASVGFRWYCRREWRGAACGCGITNGVAVSWNFYAS